MLLYSFVKVLGPAGPIAFLSRTLRRDSASSLIIETKGSGILRAPGVVVILLNGWIE
ncbi:MAG: hypothetical protein ACYDAM_11185 [Leptospirales bacterium]